MKYIKLGGVQLFVLIRLAVWCILLLLALKYRYFINRSYTHYKFKKIIVVIMCIILLIFSFIIPLENAILTFSSPEAAFTYYNNGDIVLAIDGEETALVIAYDSTTLIVPKVENGWKLGMGHETKTVYSSIDNGFWISVLRYRETNEYYIIVSGVSKNISKIEDNKDSIFRFSEDLNTYYAYIGNYDESYRLTIT